MPMELSLCTRLLVLTTATVIFCESRFVFYIMLHDPSVFASTAIVK